MGRWALLALLLLLLALLLIGAYDEQTFSFLTVLWQRLLAASSLHHLAAAMQQDINGGITKRLLPAVVPYAALCIGICLLQLVLAPAQWRMAVKLYTGTLASKLAGDAMPAMRCRPPQRAPQRLPPARRANGV
ncbi:hypothetical protein [Hymenobacter siberiensis]|uniref:hypothetical protein n=1 Tax=Hymenobacter siberiensis TaxID=2848396 RepID=UPI001C1DE1E4|nr:hypothetical protein [Hymenobacter siberiensis]MBU6119376.1 hypothetical protein [Hymenobacter siberiensis]